MIGSPQKKKAPMETNQDLEHLRLLSVFHYIVGALGCLFALIPLIYVGMGVLFLVMPGTVNQSSEPPPEFLGWIFIFIGSLFFFIAEIISIAILISGKYLKQQRKYNYSFVMACIQCVWVPFGTVLGVFTILVLSRPSVKAHYGR